MRPRRVVLLLLGSLFALLGFGLLIGGAGLGWAVATQRDDAGFFATSSERYETATAAITTEEIDLGRPGDEWWADRDLATVRVRIEAPTERALFVGLASSTDVDAYLAGVPHDEVTDVDLSPFDVTYVTRNATGTATPAAPTGLPFWRATATGAGPQTMTWDLEPGQWAIVVMNADASRGVAADIELGARVDYLPQVALGLAGAGLLVLLLGGALVLRGVLHGAPVTTGTATPVPVGAGRYPLHLEGRLDDGLSRWRWLVKWFLAIPHYLVLAVLWPVFAVLTLVAFVAILFTGRYPRRIFAFNVGVLRWTWRVAFYATGVLGTDRYPPFTLADDPTYPARLDIAYPQRLSRGLVLVKSWLLALPHLLLVGLFTANWGGRGDDGGFGVGGGLLGLLTLVAGVALLVRGTYPRGLFDLVMGLHRWMYRVIAYVALMTDEYPPFRLDQGGTEPPVGGGDGPAAPPTDAPPAWPAPDRDLVHH